MTKGRKALAGTYEARENIDVICNAISGCKLSEDAKNRAIKAVKFGLGIKEESVEKEIPAIKEKKTRKKKNQTLEKINEVVSNVINEDGDEYFPPEKCYEATK